MTLYLGIDGGGTATTAALGDESQVLARASAGPSNVVRVGEDEAATNLQMVVERVCAAAGVNPKQIHSTVVGVAGASASRVNLIVRNAVAELAGGAVEVAGDMVIAMQAAFRDEPGVIVIAGTGSIAYGRNREKQVARAGGWGYAVSDEGSGHWIGRNTVSALLRAHDAGETTALTQAIFDKWGIQSFDELVAIANAMPPPDFSALFPLVQQAAAVGDKLSGSVLHHASVELARLAEAVVRRLWNSQDQARVALGGGVFRHSPQVRDGFVRRLGETCPQALVNSDVIDAVIGALSMARKRHAAGAA